jgi:GT2 family glycosyltransferase/tetratricopeptide (TPR) repeat protein
VHDDSYYLAEAISSVHTASDGFVFVSRLPWHDQPGDWEAAAEVARSVGAEVIVGEWTSELAHRQAALGWLAEHGYTHALIPDGDEIIEPLLLETLLKIAETELAERVYVHWDTYWKTPEYVIRPREGFTPLILLDLCRAHPVGGRHFEGGRGLLLTPEHGLIHHLSYVGPDIRIRRKITTWGHRDEVRPGWYQEVWQRWDSDRLLRDLHPTHPPAYGFAERIHVPPILEPVMERYRQLAGEERGENPQISQISTTRTGQPPSKIQHAARVSVVIPVHGGREDLKACLDSLSHCRDLLHEVIVVDDASPDDAAQEAEGREGVTMLRHAAQSGFAATCNAGLEAATGDIVVFLNSDAIVPRSGLLRLIAALLRSGSIAAAGPYSNYAGHAQQIASTYTALDTLNLFAEDFAERAQEDVETDMLVGFCLAVRKSVLDEIGGFDTRFGLGTFEDNDLCYRLRRAGYRLVLASRSFVHHGGSKTLSRLPISVPALLERNAALYQKKWQADLESGYASHLSGLSPERIVFDPGKHPDLRLRQVADLARRADISLCMIVKDEERVLADCLNSARPFFKEMIVVDTGSSDRTREIARECGAQVYEFPWTESFAEARNQSLSQAKGRWIAWLDADDTLPFASGEAMLAAALNAPPDIAGFVIPVQFVDDGTPAGGTRVDHVKLFRNLPGVQFEGRIHEQILPSLKAHGAIARCNALVLHSGYDTSPAGQARKRVRDARLLELELAERPDHPFVLFNLGMTDHYGGEQEGAVRWLRRCLEVSGEGESHVRKAYALLAVSLRELGQKEESLTTVQAGLAVFPDDPELHFHAAFLLTAQGQYQEAKAHYLKTLAGRDIGDHYSSVDMGILGYKTYHNLGMLCRLLEDYPGARHWQLQAIEAAPQFLPSAFDLFDSALQAEDFATAKQMLSAVHNVEGGSENWAQMGVRYAEAIGGAANAQEWLYHALAAQPRSIGVRLVLARRLLACGREAEAREHLELLAQAGSAEAAYFLGVMAIRRHDLNQALNWMERAHGLNPGHTETAQQIHNLRQALGLNVPLGVSISLEQALEQVAADFRLNPDALKAYAAEDNIGGYTATQGNGTPEPQSPRLPTAHCLLPSPWPGGSVWEGEGQLLYALVRALKPTVIVEVGSLVGCSTSHLALACCRNGAGQVYAVDPAADFSRLSPELLPYIVPIKQDLFAWTPPDGIDFVFEDGAHTPGFTREALRKLLPRVRSGAAVLCHDACQAQFGSQIAAEFAEVMGEGAKTVLIVPSDCGLGYAVHNSL